MTDFSSRFVAAFSSLAVSAMFLAMAIAPATPNLAGTGVLA
ncbi:hypothetical protein [Altererythrobacter sp. MF3-039]